jgi:hypothetical protein
LSITPETVVLGALKKAEREESLVIRLYETAGEITTARVQLDGAPLLVVTLTPHQLRTFKIAKDGAWVACNLLEEALQGTVD